MEWISVKEKLPKVTPMNELVFCELKQDYDDEILTGYYDDETWWIEPEYPHIGHRNYRDSDIEYEITHWRPKPEDL